MERKDGKREYYGRETHFSRAHACKLGGVEERNKETELKTRPYKDASRF